MALLTIMTGHGLWICSAFKAEMAMKSTFEANSRVAFGKGYHSSSVQSVSFIRSMEMLLLDEEFAWGLWRWSGMNRSLRRGHPSLFMWREP